MIDLYASLLLLVMLFGRATSYAVRLRRRMPAHFARVAVAGRPCTRHRAEARAAEAQPVHAALNASVRTHRSSAVVRPTPPASVNRSRSANGFVGS